MKNKSVTTSGSKFAGWIEDFITGLAVKEANNKEEVNEEKEEVLAEINLNDLDKVVWKEESFGVHFDAKGASLINAFGNVVRTLPDCKTVEEVDKQLNGQEIVVAEIAEEDTDLEEELNKIANSLEEEKEELAVEKLASDEEDLEEEIEACNEDEKEEVKTASEDIEDEEVFDVIANAFNELEATIATFNERLSSVEQQYARNNEVQDLSIGSEEEEIKHFTETADESAKELAHEQAIDITSPAGRVELSTHTPATSEVQEIVTEDTTPVEEVKEEAPEVAEPKTEEKEEEIKTASDEEEDLIVEKLAGAAEKIFQKGICPETGEELVKSKTVGNYLGVYSSAGTEYAVDLETGSIYKYLK